MSEPNNDAARLATLARLKQSRAEIRQILEPPPPRESADGVDGEDGAASYGGSFPRSRTMKLLLSGRGLGTVGAVVGGLVLARPALAFKVLRMLPTGAVARMLMIKAVAALRAKD
jgi:hypothetical protein